MPALFAGVLALLLSVSVAGAQTPQQSEEPADPPAEEASPRGEIRVDAVTGRRYRHARPEEPLRRGAIEVARWVPVVLGGGAVVGAAVLLVVAHRRRGKRS